MPPRRIAGAPDITLRVDGEDVSAIDGEPVAMALAAAGRQVLGRSVKYHRPRGAACYAGRCDGCLMRVDGVPSRTTCRLPARAGMEIETQNVIGLVPGRGAEVDLLAATDWFFPGGMNHHEMFTWSKAANRAMQSIARRIAGIGRLPDEPIAPVVPIDRRCDVLVVGGGTSGLACAGECARAGLATILLDEETALGGSAAIAAGAGASEAREAVRVLARAAVDAGVEVVSRCGAVGVFASESAESAPIVIADREDALVRVRAARLVIAQGRHEGAAAFEGNDLPGVIGAGAALRLLAAGVLPGERVVVAGAPPRAVELRALASALVEAGATVIGPLDLSALARAHGRNVVSGCDVRWGAAGETKRVDCDAIVIAPPTGAVYELAEQAGVEVVLRDGSFELVASLDDGVTRIAWARVVGSASGASSREAAIAQSVAAARAIARELGREGAAHG
jgi:sarcosine oxidase subunit alpha